eukprot:TRINITY_DN5723_c0_g1_i2.p1 TRINITY_DN5723_c0_g1~~TRINITY_DN5723_c0_g1_i2.p1  ORF type:complete len:298 (+),score=38.72 TRINITY_DN5723_c0_g1_i2:2-895(+)
MEGWTEFTTSALGHTLSLNHPVEWTSQCDQPNGKIFFNDPNSTCPVPTFSVVIKHLDGVTLREFTSNSVNQLQYLYHLTHCSSVMKCKVAGKEAFKFEYYFSNPSLQQIIVCFQVWFEVDGDVMIFSFTREHSEYNDSKKNNITILKSLKVGSRRKGSCIMKACLWNGFEVKFPEDSHIVSQDDSQINLKWAPTSQISNMTYSFNNLVEDHQFSDYENMILTQLQKLRCNTIESLDCRIGLFPGKIFKYRLNENEKALLAFSLVESSSKKVGFIIFFSPGFSSFSFHSHTEKTRGFL